jgi:hypothetical protein
MAAKDPPETDEPREVTLEGPPWGEYVDPDLAYIRGQIGNLGSGALGGRSYASLGGFLDVDGRDTAEILAEVRRILKARAARQGTPSGASR